jgi:hypothetical protein
MDASYAEVPNHAIVEVLQFSSENPAETISDTFFAAAQKTTEWGNIQSVALQVDAWAENIERRRLRGQPTDGFQRVSCKALWENSSPFQGDMCPFIDQPRRVARDSGKQFPRQDMKNIIEAFTGYQFKGMEAGNPAKVDSQIIKQLRERFGLYFQEKIGVDPLGHSYQEYTVPTFIRGVTMHLVHSDRLKYPQYATPYPGFQDIILEFDEEALKNVNRFGREYMHDMAERFNWFQADSAESTSHDKGDSTKADTEEKGSTHKETVEKTYNPLSEISFNEKAEVAAALKILGITDTHFIDEEDFLGSIRLEYRKLALKYHPDGKTVKDDEMLNLNLAYEHISKMFGYGRPKNDNT